MNRATKRDGWQIVKKHLPSQSSNDEDSRCCASVFLDAFTKFRSDLFDKIAFGIVGLLAREWRLRTMLKLMRPVK